MESDKVYTMAEVLCVEDTNVLDNCDQFSGDYKQLDLFDWIVKIEVVYSITSVSALIYGRLTYLSQISHPIKHYVFLPTLTLNIKY